MIKLIRKVMEMRDIKYMKETIYTWHIRMLIYKDWRVYQTALAVSGFLDSFECSEGRSQLLRLVFFDNLDMPFLLI